MDTNTPQDQICLVEGHQNNQLIPYICVSKKCDKKSRYLCQDCLIDGTHSHNGQKPELFTKEKLSAQFNQNISLLKQRNLLKQQVIEEQNKERLAVLNQIEESLQELRLILEQNCSFSDSDEIYFQQMNALISEQFFQLTPDTFDRILNVMEYKKDTQSNEEACMIVQDASEKFEKLKSKINKYGQIGEQQLKIDDQIKKLICMEEQIKFRLLQKRNYISVAISPNNQYIAVLFRYSDYNYQFDFIDFKYNSCDKLKLIDEAVRFIQFSNDSQQLFYWELNQPFYCYQCDKKILIEYKHFPELYDVKTIITISQNRLLVVNKQNQILLLDMEFQYKIFEIQMKRLNDLSYDNNNRAIICSGEQKLQFFDDLNGNKIYESVLNLNLYKLQLSDHGKKLFACDDKQFYVIQINYNQKLVEVKVILDLSLQQKIISYSLVWNQQYFVIFEENGMVGFYDQNLKIIKKICVSFGALFKYQIDCGQCSDDLQAITVVSIKENKCQRFRLEVQK